MEVNHILVVELPGVIFNLFDYTVWSVTYRNKTHQNFGPYDHQQKHIQAKVGLWDPFQMAELLHGL